MVFKDLLWETFKGFKLLSKDLNNFRKLKHEQCE